MKKNLILTAFVACFLVLFITATLKAQSPYAVIYSGVSAGPTASCTFTNISSNPLSVYLTYWVDLRFTTTNVPDPSFWPDYHRYDAWCVSPQYLGAGINGQLQLNFNNQNLLKADYLIWRFSSVPRDASQNAALQIAVWEAAIDGTHDLSSGNFKHTGSYAAQANIYLSSLSSVDWTSYSPKNGYVTDLSDPPNQRYQDFLIRPIPEPGTLLLLGTGLLGLGMISKYRRSKKA